MRRTLFFEGVEEAALEAALAGTERRILPRGTLVVSEGDYLDEMYVVVSGSAEVAITSDGGRAEVVARVHPGETIGEMSLLTHEPASADVRAREDLDLIVLGERELDAVVEKLPQIQRNIIAILSARLRRMTRLAAVQQSKLVLVEADEVPARGEGRGAAALAASIAWHTQTNVLHLVLDGPFPSLARLATTSPSASLRPTRHSGADFAHAAREGPFADDRVAHTLDVLADSFRYLVVQHPPGWHPAQLKEMPSSLRLSDLVEPGREDDAALAVGLLPLTTATGKAHGRAARELAGLRVGVALGSGSVRGYAHIGALQALERLGVPIDCVAGTSIGAIVGALYCHFQDTEKAAMFLDELGSRMFRPTLSRKSLLSTRALRRYTAKVIGDRMLEEFEIPLAAVATDVETREEVVYRRGSAVTALLASTAVPGVFPAVRVGGRTLVDGGIVNPLPTTAVAGLGADVVVAVRLVSGGGRADDAIAEWGVGPLPSAIATIMRSVELVQTRMTPRPGSGPTIIVTPEFGDVPAAKLRHFRDGRRYIPLGEQAVEVALPRLQSALPWLRPA